MTIITRRFLTLILSFTLLVNIQTKAHSIEKEVPLNKILHQAIKLLEKANDAEQESRQLILGANDIRKQIHSLLFELRQTNASAQSNQHISKLAKRLKQNQLRGAESRSRSQMLRQQAAIRFEEGFVNLWGGLIANRDPLTMDNLNENYFSHNAKIRSVHNKVLNSKAIELQQDASKVDFKSTNSGEINPFEDATVAATIEAGMSLKIPVLSQQNAPPDLNISAFKFSRKELYFAHIEVHSYDHQSESKKQSKNVSDVPLNQIHQWRLLVTDLAGNPAKNINFRVEGHMPGHVHGLPTEPRVTKEIEPGVYLVDGMKFQMKGWWVIKFIFPTPNSHSEMANQSDFFTFNLVL